jgi:vacuolar-type H+-ATPase subunit E/Vma4
MHEYERDLQEVRRLRKLIRELRDDLDRMVTARDKEREVRPGKIKRWSYDSMQYLSNTFISGVAAEARRLEDVLSDANLELAQEILDDIEELVDGFAEEELDEEDDEEDCYNYS